MAHIKKIILLIILVSFLPMPVFGLELMGDCNCYFVKEKTPAPAVSPTTEEVCLSNNTETVQCNWNPDAGQQEAKDKPAPFKCPPDRICLENPIGTDDIPLAFGKAINAVTGIMGSLALLVFVYGGLMWLLAGGSAERVQKGTQAMIWAVIGIVVVFSSYAIITLVLNALGAT